ncbi:hypothetical protein PLESTB_000948600 [Pleodorina starrii]|uniref:TOG domain-containing protein n=1 Tax=Pleodorina starrii TaxID=330485 RepID=A0A9W6BN34_9CHLO|nr:hypothetical protein PLESTM_001150400 [Pleodorina starrii]GLC55144.1 hypothetical protein PLESTB_000948600 [Pleodorina starrii]GLC71102.1 hypothetical protein PLESTF_001074800 [Pleodorina starrii]
MTSGVPEAFGFAPAHIVADLQDIGNWKSRATAIDVLHKCLHGVASPATLVPALPDFVTFLMGLVGDPNFKISVSAMSILGDLAAKVGNELGPHLRVVVPALQEKFTDSKVQVRSAAMKLVRRLMTACSPGEVLDLMAPGGSHSNWRVRTEVLNMFIMALLSFGPGSCKPVAAYQLLSGCLSDSNEKVRLVALEGMAVLHSCLVSGELSALMAGQRGDGAGAALPEALRCQVAARLANPALPGINPDGMVEHLVELPAGESNTADMRVAETAFGGDGGAATCRTEAGAKVPWAAESPTPARTRLRTTSSSEEQSVPLNGLDHGPGPGRPAPSVELVGRLSSEPLPGCRREAVPLVPDVSGRSGSGHYQQDDPAGVDSPTYRVQPFATAPIRFGSHEPLGGDAPVASATGFGANDRGHPQHCQGHPGRSDLGARAPSPARGDAMAAAAASGMPVPRASPSLDGLQDRGGCGVRSSHGHASALQPLKHHWGASRSLESHGPVGVAAGKRPGETSEDSPLSPTRGYTVLVHGRHSGPAGIGDSGQRDSLHLLVRPASVRTQAAEELREKRGPPLHSHTHPPAQPNPHQHHQPHQQQQQPFALSQPSVEWLQGSLEQEPAVNRQETFSPSKAEMLARLKNRQIEKRAATATQQSDASLASVDSDASSALGSAGIHSFGSGTQQQSLPRRHLFSQTSDQQRERDRGGPAGRLDRSRGYDSAASTPTRAMGAASMGSFDEAPASAQSHRPPRGGLVARLGRGAAADAGGGAGVEQGPRPPGVRSPILPGSNLAPQLSEEAPLRHPTSSPALNRLRANSADTNPAASGAGGALSTAAIPIANGADPTGDKSRTSDVAAEELAPVPDPEKHIRLVIFRLVEANRADRKELDWQGQYEALMDARRVVKHHPEVVKAFLHEFVRAAAPAIDQLRSQTAKCALTLFQECFALLGRVMDRELDEVVPLLLKKAGEVSNAGRDNFLAAEADRALGEMYRCCSESRCVMALLGCAGHKNPYVRGKVAFHLDNHMEACAGLGGGLGGGGRQTPASSNACMERLFRAAAGFLEEGSLDTRTHGKRLIWHVKALLASRAEFDRLVASVTPASLQRKVVDVVEGLNGPPPPPSRGLLGGAASGGGVGGSRLASRQLAGLGTGGAPGSVVSPVRPLLEQVVGSLTQPPPPVRQGSYSAPSPMHSGAMTPEARRLPRQRATDLDGIPEGSGNGSSRNNSSNGRQGRLGAGAASRGGGGSSTGTGTGTPSYGAGGRPRYTASADGSGDGSGSCGFGPSVVEAVVKALQLLGAKDFRERMEALRAVEAVAAALPGAPDSLLMQVLDALVARLNDANAKVSMLACELVARLARSLRARMALGLNTLVPALAGQLGSTNDKIRAAAVTATDALLGALEPGMLVQHLSHSLANGTIQRGKPVLAEKLVSVVGALHGSKPQLVSRYAVPAAFALLNDGRGGVEVKAAAGVLLAGLARLLGGALLEQASSLNAVAQQRVMDAVAAAAAGGNPSVQEAVVAGRAVSANTGDMTTRRGT